MNERIPRLGAGVVAAVVFMMVASGCARGGAYTGATAYHPSPTSSVLSVGGCVALQGGKYRPVECGDRTAVARVTARETTGDAGSTDCPSTTDFVLPITSNGSGAGPLKSSSSPAPGAQGYACMRNLQAPHPGNPGAGGGPNTVVGDCVYRTKPGEVKETPCAGREAHIPRFKVTAEVASRTQCPSSTELYVGLPHSRVGCAGPL